MATSKTNTKDFDVTKWNIPRLYYHTDDIPYTPAFPAATLGEIKHFEMEKGDVMITSYPKSGTTWLSEVVYLIQNGGDLEEARTRRIDKRVPHLELVVPGGGPNYLNKIRNTPSPKLFMSHLQPHFFSNQLAAGKVKVIVIGRNPKDTLVSQFHYFQMYDHYQFHGDFNDFMTLVKENRIIFGNNIEWNAAWWPKRELDNVIFLKYENMKSDPRRSICDIASFLGKSLSDEQIDRILEATSFSKMKSNPAAYKGFDSMMTKENQMKFFRNGVVGDWCNYFTEEHNEYIDKMVSKHYTPIGLDFNFS